MPEFKSWSSYDEFVKKTINTCRYIFDQSVQEFLDTVLATSKSRYRRVPQGTIFWRSQLVNDWRPIQGKEHLHLGDEPCPLPPKRMKPLPHEAKEGRANPKGIPCLYVATDKNTAMTEVRPWLGSRISVGQLEIKKDITLVNCSVQHEEFFCYPKEPPAEKKEEAVWTNIGWAFSMPVTPNDSVADYIPTQIIAELFKNNGLDGIEYKSDLGKGHNIVLFDINIADIVNRFLYGTDKIDFSFKEVASPCFIKGV